MQLIMMTKDGCGSCQTFKPTAQSIAEEFGLEFKIIPNPTIELPYFPYYYIMSEGQVIEQWGGVHEGKFRLVLKRATKNRDKE
jgi:hypothetical protein